MSEKIMAWTKIVIVGIIAIVLAAMNTTVPVLAQPSFDRVIRDMPTVTIDSKYNSYVVWREYTDPRNVSLVMQRIASDGFRDWSQEKTLVDRGGEITEYVYLTANKQDELYLTWATLSPGDVYTFYIQKFDVSAQPLWSTPYQWLSLQGQGSGIILGDVAQPQVDESGNIYLVHVDRSAEATRILLQVLDRQLQKRFGNDIVVAELRKDQNNTTEFFYSDLNITASGEMYLTYLSASLLEADRLRYYLIKIDRSGTLLWQHDYEIPFSDQMIPVIIQGPTLTKEGNLNFGWALENKATGYLLQYAKQVDARGVTRFDQNVSTKRTYNTEMGVTAQVASGENQMFYAISDDNMLQTLKYEFVDRKEATLSEVIKQATFLKPDTKYSVNTWSMTVDDRMQAYLAWSQYTTNAQGEAGNYEVRVQKFSNVTMSGMWGDGEKANSKRGAGVAVQPAPKKEPEMKPSKKISEPKKKTSVKRVATSIDSDGDGLSDDTEMRVYYTNPFSIDSDSDGYLDGDEVTNNYNPRGICRVKRFESGEPVAYGKGRLLWRDDEQCRANYLKREVFTHVPLSLYRNISAKAWDTYTKAFIYGDYPIEAIVTSLKHGHTVHPAIPWDAWSETEEYQNYIGQ
jgi:hypothetical protein